MKTQNSVEAEKWKPLIIRSNIIEGLTIPIRFSRHSMTELLVAAEHTASFIP